jgi:hypothetical protein
MSWRRDRDGAWIALNLPEAVTFNMIRLREALDYGLRIDEFAVEIWQGGRCRGLTGRVRFRTLLAAGS